MSQHNLTVISDHSVVVETLQEIAHMVAVDGTFINPSVRVIETDGNMWVECDRLPQPTLLFQMPQSVLPDVHLAQWHWSGTDLAMSATPDANVLHVELLDAHRHLYNATGKGRWFLRHHPRAVLAGHPEIVATVQALKPNFAPNASAESFLDTRVIRRPSGVRDEGLSYVHVLMPLIDTLNHHPEGAAFTGDRGVRVDLAQPTESEECYAFYRQRSDPLSAALGYGYVDPHLAVAVSGPVAVEVPGIGRVEIDFAPPHRNSPLDPPRVTKSSDGLRLSHLTFQQAQPQRLQVPLRMLLQTLGLPSATAEQRTNELIRAVGDANLQLLTEMERAVKTDGSVSDTDGSASELPGLSLLSAAGLRQAAIISATCAGL